MRQVFKTGRPGDGGTGRRREQVLSPRPPVPPSPRRSNGGWTLIELVITMTVMTILTLGVIPLVRTSIRRQKELRLHEALRQMRNAIDEFHRDTVGMRCGPLAGGVVQQQQQQQQQQGGVYIDPRSRVVLSDCTIFGVDNPDRYPPDLQTLVDGVDVVPRQAAGAQALGSVSTEGGGATANSGGLIPKKKVYLREIPVDPITGERDWCTLSTYDPPDEGCSGMGANVFDVRSKARGEALNGEKYSDW